MDAEYQKTLNLIITQKNNLIEKATNPNTPITEKPVILNQITNLDNIINDYYKKISNIKIQIQITKGSKKIKLKKRTKSKRKFKK